MRSYYELQQSDVGRPFLKIFDRVWSVTDFMGRILPGDVGKRVYLVSGILQVENDAQRAKRLASPRRPYAPPRIERLSSDDLRVQTMLRERR